MNHSTSTNFALPIFILFCLHLPPPPSHSHGPPSHSHLLAISFWLAHLFLSSLLRLEINMDSFRSQVLSPYQGFSMVLGAKHWFIGPSNKPVVFYYLVLLFLLQSWKHCPSGQSLRLSEVHFLIGYFNGGTDGEIMSESDMTIAIWQGGSKQC